MSVAASNSAPVAQSLGDSMREFFPVGCFFHFTKEEEAALNGPPLGSRILYDGYKTRGLTQMCKGCRVSDCGMRQAAYTGEI